MKKTVKKQVKKVVDGREVIEEIEVEVEVDAEGNEIVQGDDDDAEGGDDGGDDLESADPEKLKAEIKKLRAENAKSRVKGKEKGSKLAQLEAQIAGLKKALGVESEEVSLEDQLAAREARIQELEADSALRELEEELEIPKESAKFFRFLLQEAGEELEEGEELTEEQLAEIVAKAKAVPGAAGSKKSATGLSTNNSQNPDGGKKDVTVEQFAAMNLGERTALYQKDAATYDRLMAAAREKKLL